MKHWLTDVIENKKAPPEKLAATQVMLSCKPVKMTMRVLSILTWLTEFVYKKIRRSC